MGFPKLPPKPEVSEKVRSERLKILATLVLLFVAAVELYALGYPEWHSYILIVLTIPVIFVLVYYR
jgi:hypothetical protein